MTQEEKAKAYDKAIERARIWKDKSGMPVDRQGILDDIFPELKESEDESIRKEIINYLDNFTNSEDRELVNKFIAWLEKQGKQKYTPKHKVGDTIYYNSFGEVKSMVVANITTDSTDNPMYEDENGTAVFEKDLIEQKPAWSEEDEKFVHGLIRGLAAKRDIHGHTTFSSDCIDITGTINWLKFLKDRVQPKQEWSEEDEEIINFIIALCDDKDYDCHNNTAIKKETDRIRGWLESLKDRMQTQQEWNEEDEHKIKDTIYFLETAKVHYASTVELDACIDWLKSLKPQNTWKPSEEQLKTLQKVIDAGYYTSYPYALETLYEQLKKLKG